MLISFAWTTAALLAGAKKRTRRRWNDKYARMFKQGQIVDAYDRLPRVHGHKVADIIIRATPFKQRTGLMTEDDYELEGLS